MSDAAEIIGCPLFIDLLELTRVRNPEIGAYQMVEHWNQGSFITYKGKVSDGARSYFISVHDGALLDDWRVVDTIANHALDVGSWYFDRPILAKIKKVFTPHLVNGHTALKSIP